MADTPLFAILGPAGTGKTYLIQDKIQRSPKWGKLCATTGIAALNLGMRSGGEGVITLQSTLGYFDVASLRDNYQHGKLRRTLVALASEYRYLVIDECSMLDAETLDILVDCLDIVNANVSLDHGERPLGLWLIGDFLQLPPVEGNYAFEAKNWHRFIVNTLTEIKRQSDPVFIELLASARQGDEAAVATGLAAAGCLTSQLNQAPDITTLYAVNKMVDERNEQMFRALCATGAERYAVASTRWGMQRKEWKNIPESLALAVGAYVMILSNDTTNWEFANGDCGTIVETVVNDTTGTVVTTKIKLKRTNKVVEIGRISRRCFQQETPQGLEIPELPSLKDWKKEQEVLGVESNDWPNLYKSFLVVKTRALRSARATSTTPYYDCVEEKWVVGEIVYCPLRLAYATTTHKSQGLTLDDVQIVLNHKFFGSPNMLYVALSRCRTLEGLKVVGTQADVRKYCNTSSKLVRWI
jgi:ATP-dependent exoDNAse (exonuclease V) alpha subunit